MRNRHMNIGAALLALSLCLLTVLCMVLGSAGQAYADADETSAVQPEPVEKYNKKLVVPTLQTLMANKIQANTTLRGANGSGDEIFLYSGGEQSFTANLKGTYQFNLSGASGGRIVCRYTCYAGEAGTWFYGGAGGFISVAVPMNAGDTLYFRSGGQGGSINYDNWDEDRYGRGGGSNGGGSGGTGAVGTYNYWGGAGGGGATHLVTRSGLGELKTFNSTAKSSYLLGVAGGGGGYSGGWNGDDGTWCSYGGGYNAPSNSTWGNAVGGGYQFGQGQNGRDGTNTGLSADAEGAGGGGGGYMGGGASRANGEYTTDSGAGGSGYIKSGYGYGDIPSYDRYRRGFGADDDNGWVTVNYNMKYKIAFGANTGSGSMPDKEYTINVAENLPTPTFTKSGYEAVGWSYDANCDWHNPEFGINASTLSIQPNELDVPKRTLYVVWKPKFVTIKFVRNSASLPNVVSTDSYTSTVKYYYDIPNQKFTDQGFTREGYTLTGWSYNVRRTNYNTPGSNSMTSSDLPVNWPVTQAWIVDHAGQTLTYYATWQPKQYTLHIYHNNAEANWGGADHYDRAVIFDSTENNDLTREATQEMEASPSRQFLGYFTAASGGTQVYSQYGLALQNTSYWGSGCWRRDEPSGQLNLYAHWG